MFAAIAPGTDVPPILTCTLQRLMDNCWWTILNTSKQWNYEKKTHTLASGASGNLGCLPGYRQAYHWLGDWTLYPEHLIRNNTVQHNQGHAYFHHNIVQLHHDGDLQVWNGVQHIRVLDDFQQRKVKKNAMTCNLSLSLAVSILGCVRANILIKGWQMHIDQ